MLPLVTFGSSSMLLKGGLSGATCHLQQERVYSSAAVGFVLVDCISFHRPHVNLKTNAVGTFHHRFARREAEKL